MCFVFLVEILFDLRSLQAHGDTETAESYCAQTLRGAPLTGKRSTHGVKFAHDSAGFPWLYYITKRHEEHNAYPKIVFSLF